MAINQQNYAAFPAIGSGTTITADTSYTAPTVGTVGNIVTARSNGARIDQIDNISLGTSVAGIVRYWLREGTPGPTISSITFATTTATVTTAAAHGLSTGHLVTLQAAFPNEYNVKNVSITVLSATTFTYVMATAPTLNASTVGEYSSTPAVASYHLIDETTIGAKTGSATVTAETFTLSSQTDQPLMPIILPPGWSFCTTVTVTQTSAWRTTARGGNN